MTHNFRSTWPGKHIVLPAIHVSSTDQALRNANIAVYTGCDGVFLINHAISNLALIETHRNVVKDFPKLWVGLNFLDLGPTWPSRHPHVAGMWADNACIEEEQESQCVAKNNLQHIRKNWDGLYFGGVAFKGQRKVRPEHLAQAAQKAMPFMDVVTTSGPGTGRAAEVDKIRVMKESLGDFPLAIASGITPANVSDYLPYADCFLVASGISKDFENLDPTLTQRLVDAVRS